MAWENSRRSHVPAALRAACLARDGHQCVAILRDGSRCGGTEQLAADHIVNQAAGGPTILANLQTLCDWHHNQKTQGEAAAARRQQRPKVRPLNAGRHPGLL